MRLGTAVDVLLLGGGFRENVLIIDDKLSKSTSKKSMAEKEELKAKYNEQGKTWLTASEYTRVQFMVDSAMSNHEVADLLAAQHEPQKRLIWQCPHEGWPKRGTIDYLSTDVLIDLKTTSPWNMRSKRALSDWIYQCGYHRQLAFYQEGVQLNSVTGHLPPCKLIFVGSDAPYETVVVSMGAQEIELGHSENKQTCKELADCHAYNNYPARLSSFDVEFPEWVYSPR